MNRPTAAALIGCLAVLIVYVAITSATLVRDIDATDAAESVLVESNPPSQGLKIGPDGGSIAKKSYLSDIQKAFHKRREHVIHKAAKAKMRDPITLLL